MSCYLALEARLETKRNMVAEKEEEDERRDNWEGEQGRSMETSV